MVKYQSEKRGVLVGISRFANEDDCRSLNTDDLFEIKILMEKKLKLFWCKVYKRWRPKINGGKLNNDGISTLIKIIEKVGKKRI